VKVSIAAFLLVAACGSPQSQKPLASTAPADRAPTPACDELWTHLETIDISREPFEFGADENTPPDPARVRRTKAREAGKAAWLDQCRSFSPELIQCGMDAVGPKDADACDPRFALSGP
jgi:hypothetical protein